MFSTKSVFLGDRNTMMAAPASNIFDFSSERAERNTIKLIMKQDLNFLYQDCIFVGLLENQYSQWLAETSPLRSLNVIQR